MLADGRPPALVEALLASAASRPVSNVITSTVEEITGVPARTFRSWAEEHADEFRWTSKSESPRHLGDRLGARDMPTPGAGLDAGVKV
ncbi:hypothetical protein [Streptomyces platensis]|uniref:hypothetical protein n=1 Tax=Streptomyces platensis TaxID=58346 RepID=UPI00378AB4D6